MLGSFEVCKKDKIISVYKGDSQMKLTIVVLRSLKIKHSKDRGPEVIKISYIVSSVKELTTLRLKVSPCSESVKIVQGRMSSQP